MGLIDRLTRKRSREIEEVLRSADIAAPGDYRVVDAKFGSSTVDTKGAVKAIRKTEYRQKQGSRVFERRADFSVNGFTIYVDFNLYVNGIFGGESQKWYYVRTGEDEYVEAIWWLR